MNIRLLYLLSFSLICFSCARNNSPTFSFVYGGTWKFKEKECQSKTFVMDFSEMKMAWDLNSGTTTSQSNNCQREVHYSISVAQNTITKKEVSCISSCENDSGLSQFCKNETGSVTVLKNENDSLEVLENDGDCRATYEKVH